MRRDAVPGAGRFRRRLGRVSGVGYAVGPVGQCSVRHARTRRSSCALSLYHCAPYSGLVELSALSADVVGYPQGSHLTAGSSVSGTTAAVYGAFEAVNGSIPVTYSQSAKIDPFGGGPGANPTMHERPEFQINLLPNGFATPRPAVNADAAAVESPTVFFSDPPKLTGIALTGTWTARKTYLVSASGNAVPQGLLGVAPPHTSPGTYPERGGRQIATIAAGSAPSGTVAVSTTGQGIPVTVAAGTWRQERHGGYRRARSRHLASIGRHPRRPSGRHMGYNCHGGVHRSSGGATMRVTVYARLPAPPELALSAPATARAGQGIPVLAQLAWADADDQTLHWAITPHGTLAQATTVVSGANPASITDFVVVGERPGR